MAIKFSDPLAKEIEWYSNQRRGNRGASHTLISLDHSKMMFKTKPTSLIVGGIFNLVGLVFTTVIAYAIWTGNHSGSSNMSNIMGTGMTLVIGSVFGLGGCLINHNPLTKRTFDKVTNQYLKGKINKPKDQCKLSDIHAIQIISERVTSQSTNSNGCTRKTTFKSYELNLVLKDKNRLTIVDHGELEIVRTDAETLSRFLGVRVWDATLENT
jgi:hypothetical protein